MLLNILMVKMYKYIKSYKLGYKEGYKDSKEDYLNNKRKKFIEIDKKEVLSKLYDIGYIDGYNKFINSTLNLNKNNV